MTDDFAFRWGMIWLGVFGVIFFVGITSGMPLPKNEPICFFIGAVCGTIIVGPIVYAGLRRS